MAYMWLPSVAALFLYKGSVTAPEAAGSRVARALAEADRGAHLVFELLRLDGLIWWPKTRNAALVRLDPDDAVDLGSGVRRVLGVAHARARRACSGSRP